jgi:hypothetical protein
MNDSNTVSQLLGTIESFHIVQCSMYHERVATDGNNNPVHKFQGDTMIFNRVNLCHVNERKLRLGCAHSSVNLNFEGVLERLAVELPQRMEQILSFKTEFQAVVTQIYTLDHKVGQLEHDLAVCRMTSDETLKVTIKNSMTVLKGEHRKLMTRLSEIKSDIEQLIIQELKYKN